VRGDTVAQPSLSNAALALEECGGELTAFDNRGCSLGNSALDEVESGVGEDGLGQDKVKLLAGGCKPEVIEVIEGWLFQIDDALA